MQSMIGFLRPRPIIHRKNRANNAGGKNLLTAEVNDESKIKKICLVRLKDISRLNTAECINTLVQ